MPVGVICGSGFEEIVEAVRKFKIDTPFGTVYGAEALVGGIKTYFIPRHGFKHEYPPHRVNYKGNILALKLLNVDKIIATGAVGSLRREFKPGSIVLVDQFIDYTKRTITFYDDMVVHVDVSKPYCPAIRNILYEVAKEVGIEVFNGGTYICTEGPRFETPAEIKMFKMLGADVVGMTNVPEVVLAREMAIHYGLIAIVTNYAAGMQDRVSHEEVIELMGRMRSNVFEIIKRAIPKVEEINASDDCTSYSEYAARYISGIRWSFEYMR